MGTVPSGRGQAASIPVRMASRSPAMERSMTVSAPASRATASLRFSVCRQLHSGEVPILALTLMREGWPTTMGARPAWAGLPSRTMLPASMALVMVSGARPSSWERAARCWSRRPRRAALRERMEDMGCILGFGRRAQKKPQPVFRGCGSASLRQCELRQVHRVWDYPTLSRATAVHGSPSWRAL